MAWTHPATWSWSHLGWLRRANLFPSATGHQLGNGLDLGLVTCPTGSIGARASTTPVLI